VGLAIKSKNVKTTPRSPGPLFIFKTIHIIKRLEIAKEWKKEISKEGLRGKHGNLEKGS